MWKAKAQERKRHININNFVLWLPGWGVSRPGGQGSNVYALCAEPKEHKHFRPGTWPGGSVTGVTDKLFMFKFRTRSTTTRDRNLQFRGSFSTGFLNFLQFLRSLVRKPPQMWRKFPALCMSGDSLHQFQACAGRAYFATYHPFQNHYTHEITILELFRGLQLQLSLNQSN